MLTSPRQCCSKNSRPLVPCSRFAFAATSSLAAHWAMPTSTSSNQPMVSNLGFSAPRSRSESRPCALSTSTIFVFAFLRAVPRRPRSTFPRSVRGDSMKDESELGAYLGYLVQGLLCRWNFTIFSSRTNTNAPRRLVPAAATCIRFASVCVLVHFTRIFSSFLLCWK